MARLVKNEQKWHRISIKDKNGAELLLVGSGRNVQLSIWCDKRPDHGKGGFAYFTGEKALRTLAKAILTRPKRRAQGKSDGR